MREVQSRKTIVHHLETSDTLVCGWKFNLTTMHVVLGKHFFKKLFSASKHFI